MIRPFTGSGAPSSAERTAGRARKDSHCSSESNVTSNTTPYLCSCHAHSVAPLVSAASVSLSWYASFQRRAGSSSASKTSMDHHSANALHRHPVARFAPIHDSTSFIRSSVGSFPMNRDGLRLSVTLLTVIPWRGAPAPPSRRTAGAAMAWAPAVGLLLGAGAAAVLAGADHPLGAGPLTAAALAVASLAAGTRGLHLDGLA